MTTLLLVEDDADVRHGLVAMLARPDRHVEACGTVREALAYAACAAVDLALVDLGLPDGTGVDVIRHLRARHPRAVVLVVTMFDDDDTIVAALRAGAHGYLLKQACPEALRASIDDALERGAVLSPEVARRVVTTFWPAEPSTAAVPVRIGRRELELLEHLHAGHTYEEAAARMGLGLGTVQGYIKRVYRKLGASTKVEVLRAAVRRGLLRA